MAYLSRTYFTNIANPSASFAVSFSYREEGHIEVRFYAPTTVLLPDPLVEDTDYSFTSPGVLVFLSGHRPTVGDTVELRRNTPYDLPDLTAPSVLRTSALNRRLTSLRYIAEETLDALGGVTADGALRAALYSTAGAGLIGTEAGFQLQDMLDGTQPIGPLRLFGALDYDLLDGRPVSGSGSALWVCNQFGISDGATRNPFFWTRASATVTITEQLSAFGTCSLGNSTHTVTVNGKLIHGSTFVPSSAAASGTAGQMAWDANYEYRCIASGNWVRRAQGVTW